VDQPSAQAKQCQHPERKDKYHINVLLGSNPGQWFKTGIFNHLLAFNKLDDGDRETPAHG
jgi:hypothetical protein